MKAKPTRSTLLSIAECEVAGCVACAPAAACTVQAIVVDGNAILNVNSSGASDERAVTVGASSTSATVTISKLSIMGNVRTYPGDTQYPIGLINLQAGAVALADVAGNDFSVPAMPFGIELSTVRQR
ncbi:hypothetical protein BG60_00325 [Caballeronia zhejiangensis]|jgi:hypothetical protein|uniref:Uncharacterized protein n=1 Tax=Caballeronia zhejiangensis TaxID=871203 RepID=A0A656QSM0_9BURK|nr:hypothetical protein BURK_011798 [Burkholderia sp. SJ98]KDR34246.1 hypothetical protein BG60_00325 [Caballeronia zhejiangensis]